MSSLGQYLKEAREEKQLSLDDLQRITKIQKRYLAAIESGQFDTLPGLFYARAFVKTYAETVGLDPEQLFEQFKDELPNPQRDVTTLPSRSERIKRTSPPTVRRKRSSIITAIVTIGVLVIFVVSIWMIAQKTSNDDASEPVVPNEDENVEADIGDIGSEVIEDEQTNESELEEEAEQNESEVEMEDGQVENEKPNLTFVNSDGNTSYFELAQGRLDDVRIELLGPSYIDVKNGLGKMFYSGQPAEGEIVLEQLENEKEVIFNFGASQNVNLFISGEKVEFPLDVVHQKIAVSVVE